MDEDIYTQFAYACRQLGVELESSSVPQAKGRVERLNQTLQSCLPVELRLAGITTIDSANEFLHHYIKEFNEKFALPLNHIRSAILFYGLFDKNTLSSFSASDTFLRSFVLNFLLYNKFICIQTGLTMVRYSHFDFMKVLTQLECP